MDLCNVFWKSSRIVTVTKSVTRMFLPTITYIHVVFIHGEKTIPSRNASQSLLWGNGTFWNATEPVSLSHLCIKEAQVRQHA